MELSRETMKKIARLLVLAALLLAAKDHLAQLWGLAIYMWQVAWPLLLGGAVAFVLNVPMRFLEEKALKGWRRRGKRVLSLLLTLLLAALVLLILILVIVPQLAESVAGLGTLIANAFSRFLPWLERQLAAYPQALEWLDGLSLNWQSILSSAVEFLRSGFGSVLNSTISVTRTFFGALSTLFVSFVFALYVLLQKEKLGLQCRKALFALLPAGTAERIVEVSRLSHRTFSSFITGQCVEAVILGAMFFVSMTLLRMPYALLVGCLIAVTALIPIVGAFIGCIVGAFLILVVSPVQAAVFVVLFLVLQQVEGNLIYPRVVGSSVGLPSIWVLAAVSVGGSLMGVAGMILFIPLTSVAYALFRQMVYTRLHQKGLKIE